MLAYTFYEGDNRVMRYAETLAKRGDHVDVIALRQRGQPEKDILNGVNVYRIQQRVRNEKAQPSYFFKLLLFFFRSSVFLTRKHLQNRYQFIHVHSVPDFLVFTAWLPRLTGTRIILDIHDLLPEFYASKFNIGHDSLVYKCLILTERISAAFVDHVLIANHIWAKTLQVRSVKNGKCTVVLNFPDRSIFCRHGKTRSDKKFIILYPGTLNWHQGVDIAIRAFDLIRKQVPNAELHIYGEGNAKASLASLISELGLDDRVLLNDSLSLREIAPIMENADLAVVPKRKDSFGNEAFSTKILEFMSVGTPVIVSDTKVDLFYFNDSVVKFFRGGDHADLAKRMIELITNKEIRERQIKNASQFIEAFDWDANKDEYLELVESLVQDGKSRDKHKAGQIPR